MYLQQTQDDGRFFHVPKDYRQWSQYEQFLAWSLRAARSADKFRAVAQRVFALATGPKKDVLMAKIGQKADPKSGISLYDWVWRRAALRNPHLWKSQEARQCVLRLEALTGDLRKGLAQEGLGQAEDRKISGWVWVGAAALGLGSLAVLLFAPRKQGRLRLAGTRRR